MHHIIEGYNVHVELTKTPQELEIELLKLNPCQIIMQEPSLDFIRIIEVFEASRQQMEHNDGQIVAATRTEADGEEPTAEKSSLEVHMMVYNHGTEKF